MSEQENRSRSSLGKAERDTTPEILTAGSDESFFQSVFEFIEHEKQYLQCPAEDPNELRYIIHRSVFNKVIARATKYKRLLLTIKVEYEDVIRELQRRERESREAQRTQAASELHQKSLITCQRRSAQLRERLSVIQKETADLQEEIKRQKLRKEHELWIPGLTVAQSEDSAALDQHLKRLETQRDALLDKKSHRVPIEVKAELDAKLQAAEQNRDQLSIKNDRLKDLFRRLRYVSECLSTWENDQQQVCLEDLLKSTVENIREKSETSDDISSINAELFQDEEPSGFDESKHLAEYLDRFIELFDSAQYEEAALHAARSPRGILRNSDIMEMFKGVRGSPWSVPPVLFYFEALLLTLPPGDKLSTDLSLELVHCALQHDTQLVSHSITYNKLTCSEDLGDILTEHAQKNIRVADMCLALATVAYEACRVDKKTALSMCKRGLVHSAVEFMRYCKDLTIDDCMWVLYQWPSFLLLQLLTESHKGQAAILSAGVTLSPLLADPKLQALALQVLDSFVSRGRGVLEEVILEDSRSSVDHWSDVASQCCELNRDDLSQNILSVLLDQSGTRVLTPDLEGARLVEHLFL